MDRSVYILGRAVIHHSIGEFHPAGRYGFRRSLTDETIVRHMHCRVSSPNKSKSSPQAQAVYVERKIRADLEDQEMFAVERPTAVLKELEGQA